MTELLDKVLARYGQEVTVTGASGTAAVRAFLQPVTEHGKTVPFRVTPLGTIDDRLWIYLGRAEVKEGDTVRSGTDRFCVKNSMAVRIGSELSHYWAALAPDGEAAE